MARHGKKPSEENTSSRAPRTIAGSTTPNTSVDSADGIDAATSSSAADTNAIDTNATGTRTIVSGDTAETSDQQSLEADGAVKSNESRRPQDSFDEVIAQGISDGDAWTDQHVKRFYRQIIITVVVVVVVLGAIFGFTGIRASQQMRDLAALNDCKEAVTAMNTSYSKAFQLKAKISEAFTSFDESYDLDKLAELHQTEVTAPKTLSCAADASSTISKANAAKAEYDKQAKQFKQALQKADESTATDGGDGTGGTASGNNSTNGTEGTDFPNQR
ncbi:MAG: hypothetical protein ACLT1O_04225 [Bifidobacterium pseudocatenulatum]